MSELKLIGSSNYTDDRTSVWGTVFYLKLDSDGRDLVKFDEDKVSEVLYMTDKEII